MKITCIDQAAGLLVVALFGAAGTYPACAQEPTPPMTLSPVTVTGTEVPSLTVLNTHDAATAIEAIPGGVQLVPDTAWKDTAAGTLKDILEYTPGVFVQPKWGEDARLSIRGSGLSRNFHLRGVQLYQDGVPMNAADGSADFQELDPTAFRYTEVYKGANALRYGANSLGGAINFVTPTGYDADLAQGRIDVGSFGFRRGQVSSGANNGVVDGFLTASWLRQDGFRDHSAGRSVRASGNLGWRLSEDMETRFYLGVSDILQYIPGSVTKTAALTNPKAAASGNENLNYQRNIESWRLSNKTALQFGSASVELGGYAAVKNLVHPIYQYLDYTYKDYGAYGRAVDTRDIAGHRNKLTAGVSLASGWVDNTHSTNVGGNKGGLLSASTDRSLNWTAYAENSFDLRPDLSLIAGVQFLHATRKRTDRFDDATDTTGENDYTFFNPKAGVMWRAAPDWQVFGNVARSGEAPTFGELNFTNATLADTEAQRATTFEIGTRGRKPDLTWDVAAYRAHLTNEFQYFDLGGGSYRVTNANDTVHQGIEAGLGWSVVKGILEQGDGPDRLWFNAAYTFSDFRFDDDPTWGDNDLPGAPRHFVRAELLYKHPTGFYAGPNIEWVPQPYYVDNANTAQTQSYFLLGFKAGYAVSDNFSMYLDVRNLADEKYIASTSVAATATSASTLFEPGTGRAVYVGLQAKW
ncbi:MAG: TonB-dependent receptor [Rhodospirillales bacterium]